MKITCPDCSTSYEVSAAALGPGGRSVKCARCGSRWHADGADPDTVSVETDLPADADAQAYAGTTAGGMDDDGLNADPADDWAAALAGADDASGDDEWERRCDAGAAGRRADRCTAPA